jgi:hypothetical protein
MAEKVEKAALSEMVSVVFSPEQMKAVEKMSAIDNRKIGNFIRAVVVRHLEMAGVYDAVTDQAKL